ncbi:MAG: hypothetical protein R3E79_29630 [Caldilineaceae bacterium]
MGGFPTDIPSAVSTPVAPESTDPSVTLVELPMFQDLDTTIQAILDATDAPPQSRRRCEL